MSEEETAEVSEVKIELPEDEIITIDWEALESDYQKGVEYDGMDAEAPKTEPFKFRYVARALYVCWKIPSYSYRSNRYHSKNIQPRFENS